MDVPSVLSQRQGGRLSPTNRWQPILLSVKRNKVKCVNSKSPEQLDPTQLVCYLSITVPNIHG